MELTVHWVYETHKGVEFTSLISVSNAYSAGSTCLKAKLVHLEWQIDLSLRSVCLGGLLAYQWVDRMNQLS